MLPVLPIQEDIWIENISVIIRKKEGSTFRFRNAGREGAGFVFILGGQGRFETNGSSARPLKAGDVLLLDKGSRYVISACNDEFEYITTAFHIQPPRAFDLLKMPMVMDTSEAPQILQKAQRLLLVWEARFPLYILESRLLLNEIFLELIRLQKGHTEHTGGDRRIEPALTYIHQHYDRPITLKKLADECHMSPSHFRKLFVASTGVPPLKYRQTIRLEWASRYLKSDLFSMAEIAARLGYYDIYHFSKDFKRLTGLTPSQYKKAEFTNL